MKISHNKQIYILQCVALEAAGLTLTFLYYVFVCMCV